MCGERREANPGEDLQSSPNPLEQGWAQQLMPQTIRSNSAPHLHPVPPQAPLCSPTQAPGLLPPTPHKLRDFPNTRCPEGEPPLLTLCWCVLPITSQERAPVAPGLSHKSKMLTAALPCHVHNLQSAFYRCHCILPSQAVSRPHCTDPGGRGSMAKSGLSPKLSNSAFRSRPTTTDPASGHRYGSSPEGATAKHGRATPGFPGLAAE